MFVLKFRLGVGESCGEERANNQLHLVFLTCILVFRATSISILQGVTSLVLFACFPIQLLFLLPELFFFFWIGESQGREGLSDTIQFFKKGHLNTNYIYLLSYMRYHLV